jgi:hypothetical protein
MKAAKQPHPNSCYHCRHLREDSEYSEGYHLYTIHDCRKRGLEWCRSFPFKKEQACFELDFWSAIDRDDELKMLHDEDMRQERYNTSDMKAWQRFEEKYRNASETETASCISPQS